MAVTGWRAWAARASNAVSPPPVPAHGQPARAGLDLGGGGVHRVDPGRRTRARSPGTVVLKARTGWIGTGASSGYPNRRPDADRPSPGGTVGVAAGRPDRAAWVISDSGPPMTAVYSIQYYEDDPLLPLALEWTAQSDRVVLHDFPLARTRPATGWTARPHRLAADSRRHSPTTPGSRCWRFTAHSRRVSTRSWLQCPTVSECTAAPPHRAHHHRL